MSSHAKDNFLNEYCEKEDMNCESDFIPKTLQEFGYCFNEHGQFRHCKTGEPFNFEARKQDHDYNQKRYEMLGVLVTEYVYDLLVNDAGLKKVYIPVITTSGMGLPHQTPEQMKKHLPSSNWVNFSSFVQEFNEVSHARCGGLKHYHVDAIEDEPKTSIFMSDDALTNPEKLLVLIHGCGVVRAGQWARRLVINDCLNSGTQLPYIKRAQGLGYAVIILNTNDNDREVNGKKVPIRGSKSAEEHALYVWKNFIQKAKAKYVAIVAHSYGGVVTVNMATTLGEQFQNRVFGIAFTDSVHSLHHQNVNKQLAEWLRKVSKNWVSSQQVLDTPIKTNPSEIPCVSAGHTQHEMTSWSSFASVFEFLDQKYQKAILKPAHF